MGVNFGADNSRATFHTYMNVPLNPAAINGGLSSRATAAASPLLKKMWTQYKLLRPKCLLDGISAVTFDLKPKITKRETCPITN